MNNKVSIVLIAVAAITALGASMYAMRLFNSATTPITVHEVEPGVKCAAMTTANAAALSCWKTQE